MKKIFLLLLCLFTSDSLASGIASNSASAPCTNNTLETYSGNSNLSADWQPNEIQLRWYNNNTLMDVQTAANTCTYDGALAVPSTAPTRTGYTFDGWTVRPEYDFSTFTTRTGKESRGKGENGSCWRGIVGVDVGSYKITCDDTFDDLEPGEWKNSFSYGTIYGMSMCSSTVGTTRGEIGTPVESDGSYCWCKVTGYIPSNSNIKYAPSNTLPWVYCYKPSSCKAGCADWCAWVFIHNYIQTPAFGK